MNVDFASLVDSAGSDDRWIRFFARACAALPEVAVDEAAFRARVAQGDEDLDTLAAGDLLLAHACLERNAVALRLLESRIIARLRPTRDAGFDDEVQQTVRVMMVIGPDGREPLLETFRGSGSLLGWARRVAQRVAIRLARRPAELLAHEDEHRVDPEREYARAESVACWRSAFEQAVGTLRAEDRDVLRQHYLEESTLDEVGEAWGVSRATAARVIARAKRRLQLRLASLEAGRRGEGAEQVSMHRIFAARPSGA